MVKNCTLNNGKCGFPNCVGGGGGGGDKLCGINFEGPGKCSNSDPSDPSDPHKGQCWFDKDCGSCQPKKGANPDCKGKTTKNTCLTEKNCQWTGPTCQGDGHHHINQTCDSLLSNFKKDVKCDHGYEAAVSSSGNYNGSIAKKTLDRQPCAFVCNKSTPSEGSYICSPGLGCHPDSRAAGTGPDGTRYSDMDKCNAACKSSPSPSSKGLSTAAKVALGITIAALLAVVIFLIYSEMQNKKVTR